MAAPRVLAIVLAGGRGQTADAAHRRPRQAGGALRGAVPADRLRPVERHQLAVPARHRADPVQVAQPRPARRPRRGACRRCWATTWRPCPAQQRVGKHWYLGSADAIYQCLNIIEDERPDIVVVVGADHVYRMDFSQMVDAHIASGRASSRSPRSASRSRMADQFGVIEVDPDGPHAHQRVPREADRPGGPGRLPRRDPRVDGQLRGRRRRARRGRHRRRREPGLAARHGRRHRPRTSSSAAPQASTTSSATTCPAPPSATATTGATSGRSTRSTRRTSTSSPCEPVFNLYNDEWPLYSGYTGLPPAKFVHAGRGPARSRRGLDRLAGRAGLRRDGRPGRSSRRASALHSWAQVTDSVLMDDVQVEPVRAGPPGDHRQERRGPGAGPDRPRPRPGPRPRVHRHGVRHHRRPEGHGHRGVSGRDARTACGTTLASREHLRAPPRRHGRRLDVHHR